MTPMAPMSAGRRGAVVLAATLVGVLVTANLGAWQLRRAAQKIEAQRTLDANAALPPAGAADWPIAAPVVSAAAAPASGAALSRPWPIGRRVRLRGRWVPSAAVYLENRPMDGRVGFVLVMPLRLEGRPDAVLVQRGWLPRDAADRTRLLPVATTDGPVEIAGRIAPPPARLYEFAPSSAGSIRQNLDPAPFAVETGLALQPGSVQQLDPVAGRRDELLRDWPLPAVDVQKHYGYAVQWFALAALMTGLYVWFQLVRPRLGGVRSV